MEKDDHKCVEAKYKFYADYKDIKAEQAKVEITLVINYQSREFKITSSNTSHDKFQFTNGNNNTSLKWCAVSEAIVKATIFARKELKFDEQ
jgi:hypothetical protein